MRAIAFGRFNRGRLFRAATLYAYLDTPWRFRSKSTLWKYLGIGLVWEHSGKGPEHVGVPVLTHRLLKGTILGAAQSAVALGNNPFADLYGRWIEQGLSSRWRGAMSPASSRRRYGACGKTAARTARNGWFSHNPFVSSTVIVPGSSQPHSSWAPAADSFSRYASTSSCV